MQTHEATFGAGCFWGVEEVFRTLPGVLSTEVGFMGGHVEKPSYKRVCEGDTGHAEVVHLTFDPNVVSYDALLEKFWKIHDPTQINRQGPDVGEQYRSVIFYYSDEQRDAAVASKERLEQAHTYKEPIATEITEAGPFWRAEEYHQQYIAKGGAAACHI